MLRIRPQFTSQGHRLALIQPALLPARQGRAQRAAKHGVTKRDREDDIPQVREDTGGEGTRTQEVGYRQREATRASVSSRAR